MRAINVAPCRGYIEGYYGKLLGWDEREALVSQLSQRGLSSYFYAPKEDVYHRLHWREPYPENWRRAFSLWTASAQAQSVQIIAGVAPGLDFNFAHLSDGADFKALVNKAKQLLHDGASAIALLMDDINAEFDPTQSGLSTEGQAHALLANALSDHLDCSIYVVPRVYAKELEHESVDYAQHFSAHLNTGNVVFHCGTHIVAPAISYDDFIDYTDACHHRVIAWDNLYANDYCPRRLFVGAWSGRSNVNDIMLNPTGMPATDALLIDMMANTTHKANVDEVCSATLMQHDVPEQFLAVAPYFSHPPFSHLPNAQKMSSNVAEPYTRTQQLDAIEYLLWKWKTPLSREWYPHLFGLKHDLLMSTGELAEVRIHKTQLKPLAQRLTAQ